jgi:soluble lytic murein transglycosylase-like protein
MAARKLSKTLLEGAIVGASLFGISDKAYAPKLSSDLEEKRIEYVKDYIKKEESREKQLAEYSKFLGKGLIDSWVQNALDSIKPDSLVNAKYVLATMKQESRFNPRARSYIGARGLMQIMPRTWRGIEGTNFYKESYNPNKNLVVGIKTLDWFVNYCKNNYPRWNEIPDEKKRELVSAAYNGGNGNLRKRNWDVQKMFPETKKYVKEISKHYEEFDTLVKDKPNLSVY